MTPQQQQIHDRFQYLLAMEDGWLDGAGLAPNKDALKVICKIMVERYPEELPIPLMTPTEQGGLFFEWNSIECCKKHHPDFKCDGMWSIVAPSIEIDLNSMEAEYQAIVPCPHKVGENTPAMEETRTFVLNSEAEWQEFFNFLRTDPSQHAG